MPVHDWSRVPAGIFHDFHNAWLTEIENALNAGLLPNDYFALAEQHTGPFIADVLTLRLDSRERTGRRTRAVPQEEGLLLKEAPPQVQYQGVGTIPVPQRSVAIRHVPGQRLIAVIEIVSPANRDRKAHVAAFVEKIVQLMRAGVNVLILDILPRGKHDRQGLHAAIWEHFSTETQTPPRKQPLTLVAYEAGSPPEFYLQYLRVGEALLEMPLILQEERYVPVPLESTYLAAFRTRPAYLRELVEGRPRK